MTCDPAYGGQGLPITLQTALNEFVCSSNISFGIYPGLSHGTYNAIVHHGSEEQKTQFLPKLTDGTWSGTMIWTPASRICRATSRFA